MLLDSNVIIYATSSEYGHLIAFFQKYIDNLCASDISYVEVLGYHKLTAEDAKALVAFFDSLTLLPLSRDIINQAIRLRQTRRMSLGDSLVAATALSHDLPLATRNTSDFDWIAGLELINPVDAP